MRDPQSHRFDFGGDPYHDTQVQDFFERLFPIAIPIDSQ